ncbi:hypothetical protein [Enterococcus sp. ZJ1668]|nr:hypothetical protein [Enterococcus sp. ZJ1668]
MNNEKDPEIRHTENAIEKAVKMTPALIMTFIRAILWVGKKSYGLYNTRKNRGKEKEKEGTENKEGETVARQRRHSSPDLRAAPERRRSSFSDLRAAIKQRRHSSPDLKATPEQRRSSALGLRALISRFVKTIIPRDHLTREQGPVVQGKSPVAEKVQITRSNKSFKTKGQREVVANQVTKQNNRKRRLSAIKTNATARADAANTEQKKLVNQREHGNTLSKTTNPRLNPGLSR